LPGRGRLPPEDHRREDLQIGGPTRSQLSPTTDPLIENTRHQPRV